MYDQRRLIAPFVPPIRNGGISGCEGHLPSLLTHRYDVPLHPSVERGYPSQGDAKDTVPVPDPDGLSGVTGEAGSVKWVKGEWTGDKVATAATVIAGAATVYLSWRSQHGCASHFTVSGLAGDLARLWRRAPWPLCQPGQQGVC